VVFVWKEKASLLDKFLQGYYVKPGKGGECNNNFDQALKYRDPNTAQLTNSLKSKGIHLSSSISSSLFYWGVNMFDETIGGYSEKNRKLRQAIAIAMDMENILKYFWMTEGSGTKPF